jgi:hypothetical protein
MINISPTNLNKPANGTRLDAESVRLSTAPVPSSQNRGGIRKKAAGRSAAVHQIERANEDPDKANRAGRIRRFGRLINLRSTVHNMNSKKGRSK